MTTEVANIKAPPHNAHGRRFYRICKNPDGTADVYLMPEGSRHIIAVKGVTLHEGLEEDIRARFYAWCESGEEVWP